MQKQKVPSIYLTMRERAISLKFSAYRVSQQSTLANFVQVLEQNSCFPLGGHYACQCVLFLVYLLNLQVWFHKGYRILLNLSYIPLIHAHTSWLQRKIVSLASDTTYVISYMCGFVTEYQGHRDTAMKVDMHIILCVHTIWLQMHPCLKGNIGEAWACAFSLLII